MGHCRNCGADVSESSKFCQNCGQQQPFHPIDFHFLIHEIQHSIFHLDKGILFSMKEMLVRPGKSIREFLEGRRVIHFKPLLFFIFMVAFSFGVTHYTNDSSETDVSSAVIDIDRQSQTNLDSLEVVMNGKVDVQRLKENTQSVIDFLKSKQSKLPLVGIPLLALALLMVFRRYSYAEYLVIATFLGAQYYMIAGFTDLIDWIFSWESPLGYLKSVFLFIALFQLFPELSKWKVFLKFILSVLLLLIFLLVIALMVALLVGWLSLK